MASEHLRRTIEEQARRMADKLKTWLPRRVGYILLLFDAQTAGSTEPGWLSYASSVERDGGAAIVEGLFARWRQIGRPALTEADTDDIGKCMLLEAGLSLRDLGLLEPEAIAFMQRLAAAAAKLGASADLARALGAERAKGPS